MKKQKRKEVKTQRPKSQRDLISSTNRKHKRQVKRNLKKLGNFY